MGQYTTSFSEAERIGEQLRRAFDGEAWHGPSLQSLLSDLTPEQAAAHPVPEAHSIWEIILHIASTHRLVLRRLKGDPTPLTSAEDWPAVEEINEATWRDACNRLRGSYDELRRVIADLDDAKLDDPIVPGFSTIYVTLHGLIQHDLYHAGQIAILKKGV